MLDTDGQRFRLQFDTEDLGFVEIWGCLRAPCALQRLLLEFHARETSTRTVGSLGRVRWSAHVVGLLPLDSNVRIGPFATMTLPYV